ncbi:hypothetical protein [Roseiflexus sp.]
MSNQRICYREAQIRPAHAEARRLGAPLGRRWGHGMPCPDLQPETGASRDTAGPDYSRQTFIHPR